jgi:hypothetical protein
VRRFVLIAILMVIAGSAAFAATPATKVVEYEAYDAQGHLAHALTVVKRAGAHCFGSLTTVRPDAWRCFTTNGSWVYDPCFSASPAAKQVACPSNYFERTVIVMTLTEPLASPAGEDARVVKALRPPDLKPWALALSGGVTCWLAAGATFVVGQVRANYVCSQDLWVIGYPREVTAGYWLARVVRTDDETTVLARAVKTEVL